jgi:protein SCO1
MSSQGEVQAETVVAPKALPAVYRFFSSWRFPLVTVALLSSVDLLQLGLLLAPKSVPGIGAFAEEFRVWCYRADPQTGKLELAYLLMFLGQPALTCLIVLGIWWKQLGTAFRHERRATVPYLAGTAAAVVALAAALVGVDGKTSPADLPFPAEALRTHKPAPAISLVDQDGQRVELASLQGRVVVVTGIYATCFHTCPLIMAQLDRSLGALTSAEREQVRVLAVTLNPAHDTREVLAKTALRYRVKSPEYRFLSGPVSDVDATLDRLEIARTTDPMSGQINHANLFILVDRAGNVAYRLTLGERQERWLVQALRLLVRGSEPGGA